MTYPSPYAAMLDGCVNSFEKAYGPFFLENRLSEANLYVQDDWRVTRSLTLNLGLRYEYVDAPSEVEERIDYIFNADDNNIEPRVGFAYAPAWESGFLGSLSGGTGNFSIRGGWGIYDGRLFQSIFSQGGANVRFNPPNALSRTTTTLPDILNVSDPTLGFVFVPGPQTGRVALTLPDPRSRDAVHDEVEHRLRSRHAVELDAAHSVPGQPQRQAAALRAGQPAAVAARRPDYRRQSSQQRAGGGISRICAAR